MELGLNPPGTCVAQLHITAIAIRIKLSTIATKGKTIIMIDMSSDKSKH